MYPFVDLLFPGFYFLGFERYVPVRFPSSRFGTQGQANFSAVMDIVRLIERTYSWN